MAPAALKEQLQLPELRPLDFRSLGQEDPLEEDMATHSSILACRILLDRGAWRASKNYSLTPYYVQSTCMEKQTIKMSANKIISDECP